VELQQTFLNYKRFRWMWLTIAALVGSTIVYVVDQPLGGRNGGTTVGYLLGVFSALAIAWLMAFGIRKRAYSSSLGTVEGWLAAHVWVGIGLIYLVPLHAGFSFGCNLHTLAYILMVLTIVTGIWGAANYSTLARRIASHRGGRKDEAALAEIYAINEQLEALSVGKSDGFCQVLTMLDFSFAPSLRAIFTPTAIPAVDHVQARSLIAQVQIQEREDAYKFLGLIDQKSDLSRQLLSEARTKALLKVWLYFHVPVSCALCVAVAIHIFSVFFLW
jgi:hypothetical protein